MWRCFFVGLNAVRAAMLTRRRPLAIEHPGLFRGDGDALTHASRGGALTPEIPDQAARSERHYEEVNDPDEHWRRKLHSDGALRERLFDPKWRRLHAIAAQGFGTIERSIGGIE